MYRVQGMQSNLHSHPRTHTQGRHARVCPPAPSHALLLQAPSLLHPTLSGGLLCPAPESTRMLRPAALTGSGSGEGSLSGRRSGSRLPSESLLPSRRSSTLRLQSGERRAGPPTPVGCGVAVGGLHRAGTYALFCLRVCCFALSQPGRRVHALAANHTGCSHKPPPHTFPHTHAAARACRLTAAPLPCPPSATSRPPPMPNKQTAQAQLPLSPTCSRGPAPSPRSAGRRAFRAGRARPRAPAPPGRPPPPLAAPALRRPAARGSTRVTCGPVCGACVGSAHAREPLKCMCEREGAGESLKL